MKITSVEFHQGSGIWHGMAVKDGKRFRWFIELDGSSFDVEEEDLDYKIRTHGECTCFMYLDEPPDGAEEAVRKAIRASIS